MYFSIQEITDKVNFCSKEEFIRRLCSYWCLKRQSKNGVPLLHTSMSSVNILRDRDFRQVSTDYKSCLLVTDFKILFTFSITFCSVLHLTIAFCGN